MTDKNSKSEKEMVNHPEHYNEIMVDGKPIETIKIIEAFTTMKGVGSYEGFLLGTVIKYLSRYPFKEKPVQDLGKANWYLQRLTNEVTKKYDHQ